MKNQEIRLSSLLIAKTILAAALFALPHFVFAQRAGGIRDLLLDFGDLVDLVIPIIGALALLLFILGLAQSIYKMSQGDEAGVEQARHVAKWGIVALFLMVSVWGIITLIQDDLGVPDIQELPTDY